MDVNDKYPKTIHLPRWTKKALKLQAATEDFSSAKAMIEERIIDSAQWYSDKTIVDINSKVDNNDYLQILIFELEQHLPSDHVILHSNSFKKLKQSLMA